MIGNMNAFKGSSNGALGNHNNIIDMMPVDFASNYMIVIAVSALNNQATPFTQIDLIQEDTVEG